MRGTYSMCINCVYFLYYINLFVFTEIHVCSMHTCTCSDTYMKLHKCVQLYVCTMHTMKIVCSELRVFVFENITKIYYYYNYNVYICKYVVYVYKQCYVEMFMF